MRPFKYIALLGIAGAALTGCSEIDPVIADLQLPDSQPFIRNADNYSYYRIPAIVITKHDNVLAFAEGRVDGREDGGILGSADAAASGQPVMETTIGTARSVKVGGQNFHLYGQPSGQPTEREALGHAPHLTI